MLSFQYLPYREYSDLNTDQKLKKIFKIVKNNKIVLMQGKLKPIEEARLIEETMGQVTKSFPGISFCTILPGQTGKKSKERDKEVEEEKHSMAGNFKNVLYNVFMKNRDALTIIGPANIVKEIRKNPNQIDLFIK
ncbi:DUF2073 domain-containing protein [Candidatus Woesearchaeota archaeon]|nr:DUF2073 domain-containing protein [Candidatus Woesearchaeota archaeon]